MKYYVNEYKMYQNYLERVVNETDEFESIPAIFNRYETLMEAKEQLAEKQDKSLGILEEASKNMVSSNSIVKSFKLKVQIEYF